MTADATLRVPPHNYEAEQQLLGSIFTDSRRLDAVSEFLLPEHFADPVHGRIYDCCRQLAERGKKTSLIDVWPAMEADAQLQELGGKAYLVGLVAGWSGVHSAKDLGAIVLDMHNRCELIAVGEDMIASAYAVQPDETAQAIQEGAQGCSVLPHRLTSSRKASPCGAQEAGKESINTRKYVNLL